MTISPWIQEAYERKTWLMTRGGDKRRVICVDAHGDQPVVTITGSGCYVDACFHNADGTFQFDHGEYGYDLLPPKRQFDVCVLQHGDGSIKAVIGEWAIRHEDGWTLLARATIAEGAGLDATFAPREDK